MISKPGVRERTGSGRVIYETSNMSNSKLYVGNMSFKTSEDELRQHFGQFGSVTDVYVAMDKMTGRPRGFAFVTMGTPEEAKLAAEKSNGVDLGGRPLTVNEAPNGCKNSGSQCADAGTDAVLPLSIRCVRLRQCYPNSIGKCV